MSKLLWAAAVLLGALLSACERPVVVYADPWLGGYAEQMRKAFVQQHPEYPVELKLLSSEVIAWHVRYGQPVDVYLCMGPEWLDSTGIQDQVAERFVLAQECMALAEVVGADQTAYFKTEGCVALEATHRPGRRWTEAWLQRTDTVALPDCRVYADFQGQMASELLNGWVRRAFVPASFVARHPKRLTTLAQGPVHPAGYTAFRLKNGQQGAGAALFFDFLKQEKSLKVLAKEQLIH
jgi:ABC-type molybdate transport system substrate-binding protein